MANNRMFLKCSECGGFLCIGKSYMDGMFYPDYLPELSQQINEFFDEHRGCNCMGTNFYIEQEVFNDEHNDAIRALYGGVD